ncbi:MAG TPA: SDR family oxidoreductase [Anaerolineales bacterium]|nr:SDR family oxidoreductase [Anaerolineales bacterium]
MALNIDLNNYRALVTGVSSGIGAGVAEALAQAGCDVAGCGLESERDEGPQRFLDQVQKQGRRAYYQSVDLINGVAARDFVEWSVDQLGGLDIVVSNAGRNIKVGVEHGTEEAWGANIELNLAAHWRVVQAAKPHLDHAHAPVVIIMASNHAFYTLPKSFPYNVAKAGLLALVQSLAIEWGPHVRAVGVAPGYIDTPMNIEWFGQFPDPGAKRAQVIGLHPVGRLGTPEDVGALCAFLCSPLAGYISGNTILIDGGRNAVMQDV